MIRDKVIRENEYVPKNKMLLLEAILALKGLKEDETTIQYLIGKAAEKPELMLTGIPEQIRILRDKYSEDSYGYQRLTEILCNLNGGE